MMMTKPWMWTTRVEWREEVEDADVFLAENLEDLEISSEEEEEEEENDERGRRGK